MIKMEFLSKNLSNEKIASVNYYSSNMFISFCS